MLSTEPHCFTIMQEGVAFRALWQTPGWARKCSPAGLQLRPPFPDRVGIAARPHPGRQWVALLPGASPGALCPPISLGPGVRDIGSGREAERAVTQEKRNDRNLPALGVRKGRHTPSFYCNKSRAARRRREEEAPPRCLLALGLEELTEQAQGSWPSPSQPRPKETPRLGSWEKPGKARQTSSL